MRSRFASFVAAGLVTGGLLLACGSRTGLFGADPSLEISVDASIDVSIDVVACVPGEFTFELALTQLMFVLDRSGSMAFTLDGRRLQPRSQWRWTLLQNALERTITTFDDQIAMGAKFYPQELNDGQGSSEEACAVAGGVDIPPAKGNAEAILSVFDTTTPLGGTPTSEAIRIAAEALNAGRGVARAIVLATDGAPNCNGDIPQATCTCTSAADQQSCNTAINGRFNCLDDTRTIRVIGEVNEQQRIPIYVIGIGSTERPDFLQVLDDMAVAGGRPRASTPRHYRVQSQDEMESALIGIRDEVGRCTYLTPSAPTNPDSISVRVDGVTIPRDPTKTSGWDWINREYGALAFFGDACARAQGASTPEAVAGTVRCDP
ncbi:MAG: VWA domain-containing protein [Labilithrix sp.]|nr:VWA domain-containing protein [Labilithrix sp.]MCW5816198.1 VWA domain-containing protein [Labilithrix sp.]